MSEPTRHQVIVPAPTPGIENDPKELYKHLYEIWKRTGGYQSSVTNLQGLKASVNEINMLVGINIDDTVQDQIDSKATLADLGNMAFQNKNTIDITGGAIQNVSISNSAITIPVAGTTLNLNLMGILHTDATPIGNVGTGEDTLINYSLPANTLATNLQYIDIDAWGTFAANANNKRLKLKFGTQVILDTTSVAANAGSWWIKSKIVRTGATTQQIISQIISDNTLILDKATFIAGAETLTVANNISCTGEATANDDIIQKGLTIKWFNI